MIFNWFKKKEVKKEDKYKEVIYLTRNVSFKVGKVETIIYFKDDRDPIPGPTYIGHLKWLYGEKELAWRQEMVHPTNDNVDIERAWDIYDRSIKSEFSKDEYYSEVMITPKGMTIRKDDIKEIKGLHDPNFEKEYTVKYIKKEKINEVPRQE